MSRATRIIEVARKCLVCEWEGTVQEPDDTPEIGTPAPTAGPRPSASRFGARGPGRPTSMPRRWPGSAPPKADARVPMPCPPSGGRKLPARGGLRAGSAADRRRLFRPRRRVAAAFTRPSRASRAAVRSPPRRPPRLRQLRHDQLVRGPDQRLELPPLERLAELLLLHPQVARHVRRRDDARARPARRTLSGVHLNAIECGCSRLTTVNILPAMQKQRSWPHLTSSVTPGSARQIDRTVSTVI